MDGEEAREGTFMSSNSHMCCSPGFARYVRRSISRGIDS
jgi:hypothetical protein